MHRCGEITIQRCASKVINKRNRRIYKQTNVSLRNKKKIAAAQPAPSVPHKGLGLRVVKHFVRMLKSVVYKKYPTQKKRVSFLNQYRYALRHYVKPPFKKSTGGS